VALDWTLFVALNLDLEELLAGPKIPPSKPSRPLMLTKTSVLFPFTVNGRITLSKGPTLLAILFVLVSATKRNLEFRPAK
jgi:hypothetical protein